MGFNSWQDYEKFVTEVKNKNRFIHSCETTKFLDNIKRALPAREFHLNRGSKLFRARINGNIHEYEGSEVIEAFAPERMKPLLLHATEGRANAKGMPYLYLSDDEKISLSELRPYVGQYISLAQFAMSRNLRVVDCCSPVRENHFTSCIFSPPQSQEEIGNAIWSIINIAFTRPISNSESSSDYVPTQILAELFKSQSFDGARYKSNLGDGNNFVLFDLAVADLVSCTLRKTESINYSFVNCQNPCPVRGLRHEDYM